MARVLIVGNYALGLYNFRREFLLLLKEQGHEVHFTVPYGEEVDYFKAQGLIYHPLEFERREANPFNELKLLQSYGRMIRSVKPDLVISYSIKPNLYMGLWQYRHKYRHYPMITGLGTGMLRENLVTKLLITLLKVAFSKATSVIFLNESNLWFYVNRHIIKEAQAQRIQGEGVNIDAFTPKPLPSKGQVQPVRFLYLGRLMKEKGIHELLDAIEILRKKYPGTKDELHLYGITEETEVLERIATSEKQLERVYYHGPTKQPHQVLLEHDCLILPSYHEGMSMVVQEALASGRPVIGSDIPGIKEAVVHGWNGFLVPKQEVEALAEAMEQWLNLSEEQRCAFSVHAREKVVKEFNRETINWQILKILVDGLKK